MDLSYVKHIWRIVTSEKIYLDTEIQCCDGLVQTNKCFLLFSEPTLNFILNDWKEDQIKIFMPEFTCLEVFHLTRELSFILKSLSTLPKSESIIKEDFFPGEKGEELVLTSKFVVEKEMPNESSSKIKCVSSRSKSKCCSYCGLQFESSAKLAKHSYNVHPKSELRFECQLCFKKFHYKYLLDKHDLRKHSNLSFSCDICQKTFSLKCNLLKHHRKFH